MQNQENRVKIRSKKTIGIVTPAALGMDAMKQRGRKSEFYSANFVASLMIRVTVLLMEKSVMTVVERIILKPNVLRSPTKRRENLVNLENVTTVAVRSKIIP